MLGIYFKNYIQKKTIIIIHKYRNAHDRPCFKAKISPSLAF